jgi:hypothetical protein
MRAAFVLCGALTLLGGVARADELANADKLLEARKYAEALPLYSKLAAAGNPAAQFHLGEMYWYGEGVPADAAQGDEWFRKADQAGYPEAKGALGLTAQRQARLADINYYVQRYDGADVALSNFNCVKPDIPVSSQTAQQIKGVSDRVDGWLSCYDGFLKNLAGRLPAGKAIPADLANLMTDAELREATVRMDGAYAAANSGGKEQADQILAAREKWLAKTDDHVKTAAARTKALIADQERLAAILQAQANAGPGGKAGPPRK